MVAMNAALLASLTAIASLAAAASIPDAAAQTQIGGVSVEGEWYVGEGLGVGDYFSYSMCHTGYKECKEFQIDFWIEADRRVNNESKWIAQTVVYDGTRVSKGTMELGKVAPEPTGGSIDLEYRSAFKSSIVWLSAFATSYGGSGGEGPKRFDAPAWGKIANIGGEQILPKSMERVKVKGGTFEESVIVSWRTGGAESRVWLVDEFPFPVKAHTWVHVSEGIPPQEYAFELLEYGTSDSNPYADVLAVDDAAAAEWCPETRELVPTKRATAGGKYLINVLHGPEMPVAGCDMTLLVSFHSKYDETEFLNQVQYDILVTDSSDSVIHTVSEAEGSRILFSGSGQTRNDETWVPDAAGEYTYAIVIHGLAPLNTVTRADELDVLRVPVTVVAGDRGQAMPVTPPAAAATVPSWIKQTAGFWVDGHTGDAEFVAAIEFLISRGVIDVGPQGTPPGSGGSVPSWIKQTAGFWVGGHTGDAEFVAAIEFLVGRGVISVS